MKPSIAIFGAVLCMAGTSHGVRMTHQWEGFGTVVFEDITYENIPVTTWLYFDPEFPNEEYSEETPMMEVYFPSINFGLSSEPWLSESRMEFDERGHWSSISLWGEINADLWFVGFSATPESARWSFSVYEEGSDFLEADGSGIANAAPVPDSGSTLPLLTLGILGLALRPRAS